MKNVSDELAELIAIGERVLDKASNASRGLTGNDIATFEGWVARLGHIIRSMCGAESDFYKSLQSTIASKDFHYIHSNHYGQVGRVLGVANAVKHAVDNGLLDDIRLLMRAEVFVDFLDMGEHLLCEGYKDAAAVIVGSVLEDTLRKLSAKSNLPEHSSAGKPLTIEPLNAQLAKAGIYNKLDQKQITSWAQVRNDAAHGRYGEYTSEHVKDMLLFVQRFAANQLK